jgi:hypothetical protein
MGFIKNNLISLVFGIVTVGILIGIISYLHLMHHDLDYSIQNVDSHLRYIHTGEILK